MFLFCSLHKIKDMGRRSGLPTFMEIEALKRGGSLSVKVYFCDKKFLFCRADSWTTFKDLHEMVSSALYLLEESESCFCFYEVSESDNVERVPGPDERVLDMVSRWCDSISAAGASKNKSKNYSCFCSFL